MRPWLTFPSILAAVVGVFLLIYVIADGGSCDAHGIGAKRCSGPSDEVLLACGAGLLTVGARGLWFSQSRHTYGAGHRARR
jgi:hypothetical protein